MDAVFREVVSKVERGGSSKEKRLEQELVTRRGISRGLRR
jgi:hypothetical protein